MTDHITGESKIHEVMLLGEVGKEPERELSIRWSHLPMAVALSDTRAMQPAVLERNRFNPEGVSHTPTCPGTDFANDLHAEIAEKIGLWNQDKVNNLKYFIGVHGPADSVGVDCWFELTRDDGQKVFALVDHTENPKKDNPEADYIMLVNPDRDMDNGVGYQAFVKRTAAALAHILESKPPDEELQYED